MEVIAGLAPRGITRLACVLLWAISSYAATAPPQEADNSAPVLQVDQAVQIALANNRDLKIVSLDLDSSKEKLAAEKTRRLPAFNTYVFASQLLQPISFTVPAGQFGTYPGIGPIPATNTPISTPSQPTAYVFATASQPLLTLYKINLHIHGQQLSVEQAAQKVREERISIVDDVRAGLLLHCRDPERHRSRARPASSNTRNWTASPPSMSPNRSR